MNAAAPEEKPGPAAAAAPSEAEAPAKFLAIAAIVAIAALATFAAYGNALLWGQFQFDDYNVIIDNPRVHSWQAWWGDLGHGIRPILKFSYTLDWTSGWGVSGFHLTNILIHLVNVLLVWRLALRLANQHSQQPGLATGAMRGVSGIARFTALLFALHPIHTEAVTYVCGRSASLMTMFYLAGLLAYAAGRQREQQPDGRLLHVLTPFCFLLALGSKETAATFPLALLTWEFACGGSWRSALRRQWSSWLLLGAGALFFLTDANYLAQMERSAGLNSLLGNLATQLAAIAYLLRQWVAPLWLNIDPDLPLLHEFSAQTLPMSLFALLGLPVLFLVARRRPWLGFALAWTIIQLLPLHLFLPRLDVANERQLYLVSWPLAFALATELSLHLGRRTFIAVAAALLLLAGGLTVARNRDYRSEVSLWEATVRLSPDKARAHNNLGYAYGLAGRSADAQREYLHALQLDPDDIKARRNLARLQAEARQP